MRKLLDRNDPFFRRVWVRWLTVILPLLWGAVEFWHSQPFWGVLFIAAAYVLVNLITDLLYGLIDPRIRYD